MPKIELYKDGAAVLDSSPQSDNWYIEPFTKRKSCSVPGQCGADCDCGCPYKEMTEVERLPLISDIAQIFPNEWLAFIISPEEDDEYEPVHGKLIAHSREPDEVYDAVNTVLWNQHIFVYFNGDFEGMQASYSLDWHHHFQLETEQAQLLPGSTERLNSLLPDDPFALVYSALDHLYSPLRINEAIRRLRLARVRVSSLPAGDPLIQVLDAALNKLETSAPVVEEIIWDLEEALADLEAI